MSICMAMLEMEKIRDDEDRNTEELWLTRSSKDRSFASSIISRVVVHFSASTTTQNTQVTNFSSLIRYEGETGEKSDLVDIGTGSGMIQQGKHSQLQLRPPFAKYCCVLAFYQVLYLHYCQSFQQIPHFSISYRVGNGGESHSISHTAPSNRAWYIAGTQ